MWMSECVGAFNVVLKRELMNEMGPVCKFHIPVQKQNMMCTSHTAPRHTLPTCSAHMHTEQQRAQHFGQRQVLVNARSPHHNTSVLCTPTQHALCTFPTPAFRTQLHTPPRERSRHPAAVHAACGDSWEDSAVERFVASAGLTA
jgi:hypothetical protein